MCLPLPAAVERSRPGLRLRAPVAAIRSSRDRRIAQHAIPDGQRTSRTEGVVVEQHGATGRAGDGGAGTGAGATPTAPGRPRSTWLPVLTFLAGAGITAAAFLIGGAGADPATPAGGAVATPPASQPDPAPQETDPALQVRVPAPCLEAAEYTDTVTAALGEIAQAARDLDARRLQETLDAVQRLSPDVEAAARQCRQLAAEGQVVPAPSPQPTSPTGEASPPPESPGAPGSDGTGEPAPTATP